MDGGGLQFFEVVRHAGAAELEYPFRFSPREHPENFRIIKGDIFNVDDFAFAFFHARHGVGKDREILESEEIEL